jgi:hypothetical protein
MKALTLYPIWAWLVIHGPKRVENRTWRTTHRGRLAIHAGKSQPNEAAIRDRLRRIGVLLPDLLPSQQILGTVDLVDVMPYGPEVSDDPFAEGPVCWILSDPQTLAVPISCRGFCALWNTDLL